ncbi:hypothetical protein HDF16_004899 [Granulicella aggregans]|uniref:DinB-like domain-containing protein n=1 Tax=Granulicella aggregans TaxID=474949 RepID=A0A7W7ZI46_9BACT|nr:DinB family protein [Granulicella aggregans]MBB5060163.1 hypothetical protein [Granulicella aggregans]
MLDRLHTVSSSLKTIDDLLVLSLSDLTPDLVTRPTRNGEGPSILWQIEHMMTIRHKVLQVLRPSTPAQQENSNTPVDLAHLIGDWTILAANMQQALETCTPAVLESPQKGVPHGEPNIFGYINFFLGWHEVYHFGAIGVTRKLFGLAEVADLVRAQHKLQSQMPTALIASNAN